MLINKITNGFVIQQFDTDTGLCVGQEFIASDEVEWENQKGIKIDPENFYFPLEMKNPNE